MGAGRLPIGATGKTGRRIAQRLSEKGHAVRKGSRQSDPPFDWQNPRTWPTALHGTEAAYISFFPDHAVPGAPAAIEELASCAITAGVKRIVLLSGRGEVNAQRCENIVRECGVSFTLIRASWFSQNFDEGHLLTPVLSGTVASLATLPTTAVPPPLPERGIDEIAHGRPSATRKLARLVVAFQVSWRG